MDPALRWERGQAQGRSGLARHRPAEGRRSGAPVGHGHVVVVVSGPLAHKVYPTAYWGRLGGVGRKDTTVNYAWKSADLPNVVFAARPMSP